MNTKHLLTCALLLSPLSASAQSHVIGEGDRDLMLKLIEIQTDANGAEKRYVRYSKEFKNTPSNLALYTNLRPSDVYPSEAGEGPMMVWPNLSDTWKEPTQATDPPILTRYAEFQLWAPRNTEPSTQPEIIARDRKTSCRERVYVLV